MIQRICNLTQRYAPGRKISPIYEALGQPEYSEFERIGSCSIFHRLLVRSKLWTSNDYDKDFQYKNSMIINSNTSVAFEIEKFILIDESNEVKAQGKFYHASLLYANKYSIQYFEDGILDNLDEYSTCFQISDSLVCISPNEFELY